MKILLVHNRYRQRGGEDAVFEAERDLLRRHGHEVATCEFSNDDIAATTIAERLKLAAQTIWSSESYRRLAEIAERERPLVAHFHNTLPLVSPAGYAAVRRAGGAVVQTLHNYRHGCPSGLLLRDGKPCEACLGRAVAWPAIRHGCYRTSRPASATVAAMLTAHRALGTFRHGVDAYVAPSAFAREKLAAAGLDAAQIHVKPHFLAEDPGAGRGDGGFALYAGRLSEEKGIRVMLDAWAEIGAALPLVVVGDGPLAPEVEAAARRGDGVTFAGPLPKAEVLAQMQAAALLLVPSDAYETFGLTIIEAFAGGTPVVASRRGPRPDLIAHGHNGFLFEPGDAGALAAQIRRWLDQPQRHDAFRHAARTTFEQRFTAETNYARLLEIYETALAHRFTALPAHAD